MSTQTTSTGTTTASGEWTTKNRYINLFCWVCISGIRSSYAGFKWPSLSLGSGQNEGQPSFARSCLPKWTMLQRDVWPNLTLLGHVARLESLLRDQSHGHNQHRDYELVFALKSKQLRIGVHSIYGVVYLFWKIYSEFNLSGNFFQHRPMMYMFIWLLLTVKIDIEVGPKSIGFTFPGAMPC